MAPILAPTSTSYRGLTLPSDEYLSTLRYSEISPNDCLCEESSFELMIYLATLDADGAGYRLRTNMKLNTTRLAIDAV